MGARDKPSKVKVTKAPKIREISKAERGLRFRAVFGKTALKQSLPFFPGITHQKEERKATYIYPLLS
jgi:hypothetical protein